MKDLLKEYGIDETHHDNLIPYLNKIDNSLLEYNIELLAHLISNDIKYEFTDEKVGHYEVSSSYRNDIEYKMFNAKEIILREAKSLLSRYQDKVININSLVSRFGLIKPIDDLNYELFDFDDINYDSGLSDIKYKLIMRLEFGLI